MYSESLIFVSLYKSPKKSRFGKRCSNLNLKLLDTLVYVEDLELIQTANYNLFLLKIISVLTDYLNVVSKNN